MTATAARLFVLSAVAHAGLLALWLAPPADPSPPVTTPVFLTLVDEAPAEPAARHEMAAPLAADGAAAQSRAGPQPAFAQAQTHASASAIARDPAPAEPSVSATSTAIDVAKVDATAPAATVPTTEPSTAAVPTEHGDAAKASASRSEQDDAELASQLRARLRGALAAHFVYPPLARRHGWQGEVKVGLRVNADGRLSDIHLVNSSGHGVLDRAALQSLAEVRRLDGGAGWLPGGYFDMVLPIQFRLVDG